MEELKINDHFYFTGIKINNNNIYIDINHETDDLYQYEIVTKEKAKEIIEFLTKFVEGE